MEPPAVIKGDWMGDEWCGVDVDTIFAYQTPRVALIKDRTLGIIKNGLVLFIFMYIFVFSIWYKGAHLKFAHINGVARLQWQEPTQKCNPFHKDCSANYVSAAELPYCKQYKGKEPLQIQRDCDYFDARELPMNILQGVLIPTFITEFKQARACPRGSSSCSKKWRYVNADGSPQTGKGYAQAVAQTFVADVNDFTVLIDHSMRTTDGKVQQDDYMMQGYFKTCDAAGDCQKPKPIKCVHKKCKEMHMKTQGAAASFLAVTANRTSAGKRRATLGRLAPEPQEDDLGDSEDQDVAEAVQLLADGNSHMGNQAPQVIAIKPGDVMSLQSMLAMAGKSLDDIRQDEEDDGALENIRLRGAGVVVQIMYENLERWTLFRPSHPWYTISVTTMASPKFKHATVKAQSESSRDLQVNYGTYVVVKQIGKMAYFDPVFAIIALTSAMGLLAVSNVLTDLVMLKLLPRKDTYKGFKYMESEDLNKVEN